MSDKNGKDSGMYQRKEDFYILLQIIIIYFFLVHRAVHRKILL